MLAYLGLTLTGSERLTKLGLCEIFFSFSYIIIFSKEVDIKEGQSNAVNCNN